MEVNCRDDGRSELIMNLVQFLQTEPDVISLDPASEKSIQNAEQKLQLHFSEEYKEYIKTFGLVVLEEHELTGICDGKRLDVVVNTISERERNPFVPKDWYVVECLYIDGIVIWQNQIGEVYQTFPNGHKMKLADSLYEYMKQNIDEEI